MTHLFKNLFRKDLSAKEIAKMLGPIEFKYESLDYVEHLLTTDKFKKQ